MPVEFTKGVNKSVDIKDAKVEIKKEEFLEGFKKKQKDDMGTIFDKYAGDDGILSADELASAMQVLQVVADDDQKIKGKEARAYAKTIEKGLSGKDVKNFWTAMDGFVQEQLKKAPAALAANATVTKDQAPVVSQVTTEVVNDEQAVVTNEVKEEAKRTLADVQTEINQILKDTKGKWVAELNPLVAERTALRKEAGIKEDPVVQQKPKVATDKVETKKDANETVATSETNKTSVANNQTKTAPTATSSTTKPDTKVNTEALVAKEVKRQAVYQNQRETVINAMKSNIFGGQKDAIALNKATVAALSTFFDGDFIRLSQYIAKQSNGCCKLAGGMIINNSIGGVDPTSGVIHKLANQVKGTETIK